MSTVLVVEDNKDVSFMISEMLRYHISCQVITAQDGQECLRLVKEKAPDIILLDIHMPGLDGFEVCKILKGEQSTKEIPIIFLTATLADLKSKIRGLEIGADDYLVQPIDNLELVTRVKAMLRIRQLIEKAKGSDILSKQLHDLRSPLNGIMGFSELLASEGYGSLTAKQKEFIGLIRKSAQRLLEVLEGYLKK